MRRWSGWKFASLGPELKKTLLWVQKNDDWNHREDHFRHCPTPGPGGSSGSASTPLFRSHVAQVCAWLLGLTTGQTKPGPSSLPDLRVTRNGKHTKLPITWSSESTKRLLKSFDFWKIIPPILGWMTLASSMTKQTKHISYLVRVSVFSYSTWPSETKVPKFKLRCSVERCPEPIIPGLSHPSLLSLKIGLWGSLEEKYVAFDFTAPVSQFSRNLAPIIMNHQHHKHHIHKCSVFSNVNWRMGKGI